MAKKKRKLSIEKDAILKEYRKARANLRRRIKYYRDRGFLIPESALPKIPEKVTEGSIRNLKRASERLFDKAAYKVRDNINYGGRIYKTGDVVFGKRGLKIYQKEERQYRAATRALERGEYFEALDDGSIRQLTGEGQPPLTGGAEVFDDLIYNRIISTLMDNAAHDPEPGTAQHIYQLILDEEEKVGRDEVVRRFAEAGEAAVEALQTVLRYKYSYPAWVAYQYFMSILEGRPFA